MTSTPPRSTTPPPYKKKDGGGVAALPFSLGFSDPAGGVMAGFGGVGGEPMSASPENPSTIPADRWPWLTQHFKNQLPTLPTDPALAITCGGCIHSKATDHTAILHCSAGIESGLPIGGHWATDRHYCPSFTDRATGRKPAQINTTRDTTQTTTRELHYNPFEI